MEGSSFLLLSDSARRGDTCLPFLLGPRMFCGPKALFVDLHLSSTEVCLGTVGERVRHYDCSNHHRVPAVGKKEEEVGSHVACCGAVASGTLGETEDVFVA